MKRNLILIIVFAGITAVFSGCKKGKDDPLISLLSRKARICGEWKVVEGEVYYVVKDEATDYTESDLFAENALLTIQVPQQSYSGTYSWRFTINKDGTYKIYKSLKIPYNNAFITEEEGYWYFLSKNKESEIKNKECIAFQTIKDDENDVSYEYKASHPTVYEIVQLTNKKLKLISDRKSKATEDGSISETNINESLILAPNK